MIISDLDGTIVKNGKIPYYTHSIIDKLKRKHIDFCVATGRQYRDFIYMFPYEKPISITLNGALTFDNKGAKIYIKFIEDKSVDALIEFSKKNNVITGFYIEEGIVSLKDAKTTFAFWIKNEYIKAGKDIVNIENEMFYMENSREYSNKVLKVEMILEDSTNTDTLIGELKFIENVEIFKTSEISIEVTCKGVDKAKAICELLKYYGISENEIIVCGDSGNDISMLSLFKNSLVPCNGTNEAKQVAKVITDSVSNQGIAKYLDSLLDK